jgi:NADH-quinone oxidoreductase subunit J
MDLNTFLFWLIAALTGLCAIAVVVTQNIVRSATWLLFTLAGTAGIFFLLGADFVGATQILVYVGGTLVLVVFGVMLTAQGPFISMKTSAAEWVVSTVVGLLLYAALALSILSPGALTLVDSKRMDQLIDALASPKKDQRERAIGELKALGPLAVKPLQEAREHHANPQVRQEADQLFVQISQRMSDPSESMSTVTLGASLLGFSEATPAGNLTGTNLPPDKAVRTQVNYLLPFEIVSVHLLVVLIGAAYLARAKRRRGALS